MQLNLKLLLILCVLLCGNALAQTPAGSLGDPVVQEDFGSGNMPHYPTTSYLYISGNCPASGYYALAKTEGGCHPTWHTLTKDHTGNDGYMMIIDAATDPGLFYSQETPPLLCSGTTYEFSAFVKNLVLPAYANTHTKPDLTFRIETLTGIQIGQSINTGAIYETESADDWQKVSAIVTIPPGVNAVVVKIFNNSNGIIGNDLVLDDIAFRAYGPQVKADFGGTNPKETADLCVGESGNFSISASISPTTSNTRLQWQQNLNDGNGWVDILNATNQNYSPPPITNAQIGSYQYRLGVAEAETITSQNCRVYSNPVTIKVSGYPHPPDLPPVKICEGKQLVITASGGDTYKWTGPNLPAAGVTVNPLVIDDVTFASNGNYRVEVISAAGCATPKTVTVNIVPRPVISSMGGSTVLCKGDVTTLDAVTSGASSFSWSPAVGLSDANSANPVASPTATTTYTLTAFNSDNCSVNNSITITVNNLPLVSAGNDKAIFEGQSITLDGSVSGNVTSFSWSPATAMSDPNVLMPSVSPTDDITYTLNVTSPTCDPITKSVFVRVYKKIIIPNSFSPNSDGINDLWNIEALFTYPESITAIYDRNGQQVFFSRGYSKPWDGKRNGANLPTGTYYYNIDLKNGTSPLRGWVLIIR